MKIPLTETEKEVMKVIKSRWKIGRERYKAGISHRQSANPINWVEQAIEEAADQLQYLVALKLCLIKISGERNGLQKLSKES